MHTYLIKIETERMAEVERFLAILKAMRFVTEVKEMKAKPPISRFRGILPASSMDEIDRNIENLRKEWEKNI